MAQRNSGLGNARILNEWPTLPTLRRKKEMGNVCWKTLTHHKGYDNNERQKGTCIFCGDGEQRLGKSILHKWKKKQEYRNRFFGEGENWEAGSFCGEEAEGCSNQEQEGEKEQSHRLGFSRAEGAILQCYQYLLMAAVTPRNRSFAGKTYMVRSLLNKVRKNLKYYRQGSFDHKIWKYTPINPPNHRTNGIIHSSHVLLNTVTTS